MRSLKPNQKLETAQETPQNREEVPQVLQREELGLLPPALSHHPLREIKESHRGARDETG